MFRYDGKTITSYTEKDEQSESPFPDRETMRRAIEIVRKIRLPGYLGFDRRSLGFAESVFGELKGQCGVLSEYCLLLQWKLIRTYEELEEMKRKQPGE